MKITMPDGNVTVHLDGERYRGAYNFEGDELIVTAYGLETTSTNMAALQGECDEAALNLAKLVLIDMVRDARDIRCESAGLSLQGSTTRISCDGSTTRIGL